mmetsp:Transcript_32643/g.66629  ORF Transcript_32643/g.66629 Transcript_32643/m.66629 type:complete len:146 (+) Transcript_32643:366-803(+)
MSILSFCLAIFIATLQHFILDFGSSVVYDGIKQIPDDITREIKFKEQQKVAALKKTVARRQVLFKKSFGEESPEMMGLQKEVAWVESCLTVINQNGVPEVESEDHVAIKVEVSRVSPLPNPRNMRSETSIHFPLLNNPVKRQRVF